MGKRNRGKSVLQERRRWGRVGSTVERKAEAEVWRWEGDARSRGCEKDEWMSPQEQGRVGLRAGHVHGSSLQRLVDEELGEQEGAVRKCTETWWENVWGRLPRSGYKEPVKGEKKMSVGTSVRKSFAAASNIVSGYSGLGTRFTVSQIILPSWQIESKRFQFPNVCYLKWSEREAHTLRRKRRQRMV